MSNDYFDYKSGVDFKTMKTPFSGGSGVLPQQPVMAPVALITGIVALVITAVIGGYFALERGPGILPVGLVGVLVIVAYTPWLTRRAFYVSLRRAWDLEP
jgi:1,4-dihydroxy-2-naphthoate octaprenyltransferase